MIKVHKDLTNIPNSFLERKTETRRNTCIRDIKYHQNKDFNKRFKQNDIKEALGIIYYNKCAYCEQKVIESTENYIEENRHTIEHYRPKSIYYWLAYSWDNLLWCCRKCNQNKDNNFEIYNLKVAYSASFLTHIHSSSIGYHNIENPKMIHPEIESIINHLSFFDGIIASDDERIRYTINTCKLDRDELNEKRKTILDIFIKKVKAKISLNESYNDILEELINDFKESNNEFRALRYWMLRNYKILIEITD